jgi:glycosyltransferase involved in cell wall biosynthesis
MLANFADRVGGGEEGVLSLAEALDRSRWAVRVAVPRTGELASALAGMVVPCAVLPLPAVRPWTVPASAAALRRLAALVAEWRIALVHAHGSRGALYAGLAVRRRVPLVWHARIVDRDPWLDWMLVRLATAVIANSQATAGRFAGLAAARDKVHVVLNGVDLERFSPGPPDPALRRVLGLPPSGPVIGYVGRLERGKGPDVLLTAAGLLRARRPDVCFLFVGDGPLAPELAARAARDDLAAVFVGRRRDLPSVLRLCALLAVPSRQEAFGRALVEAMASEVPVVAARVGGIPEVVTDGRTGLLVPPEDPAALARALEVTLTDVDATRARVRAAAADARARFSLAAHTAAVSRVYEAVLSDAAKGGTSL